MKPEKVGSEGLHHSRGVRLWNVDDLVKLIDPEASNIVVDDVIMLRIGHQ